MGAHPLLVLGIAAALLGCPSHHHFHRGSAVELVLRLPEARQVALATSLDGFAPHPARRGSAGTWHVSVPANGEFRYFYIVDGEPFVPDCERMESDDFGGANCIHAPTP